MEFHFNFDKPTISKNVGAFLLQNVKTEREKDLLNRIISGRKLQYGDTNHKGPMSYETVRSTGGLFFNINSI